MGNNIEKNLEVLEDTLSYLRMVFKIAQRDLKILFNIIL